MAEIVFYVFAALAIGGGLGMVTANNPVASLLFMVAALGSLAGIFVLLEAHFLAAIQVIVYAGAIMVLFLFVIMLLNLGHDYQPDLRRGFLTLVAFAMSGAIGGLLARRFTEGDGGLIQVAEGDPLMTALEAQGAVGAISHPLFTDYVVGFELAGVILLVAIVGAIALAKRSV